MPACPSSTPRTTRGIQRIYGDEPIKVYGFFKEEFFGMERTLDKIVRYFHSAAMGGEECRQVLYLMGPVGSGKSSLVDRLIRGLEELRPIYAIDGDPMQGDPLTLVPRHLRPAFEEMLGVKIEGDLNPVTRYRLLNEFGGRYEEMPVRTVSFSKRARRGIGVVPPVDPNNQDTSVLIGSEDISKLDRYSEGDPRILELNGAFNVGNRGMVEFIEVFKNETEYLHTMITATQERFVPAPGRHGTVYVDTCIVAHSNEAEWQKFKADHTNEAILDRIVVVRVPYNLRLSEEVKIYEKFLGRSKFDAQHRAVHARDRLDVRDPHPARADRQVRSDDQAAPVQRRGGDREGPHQEAVRARVAGGRQARGHVRHLDPLHHEGAGQRAQPEPDARSIRSACARR